MGFFEGFVWKTYDVFGWIMRLIYLNLLWLLFTVVGLIALGIFPATAAMFAVTRKWIQGETDVPIFTTFLESFKSSFIQINLVGYCLLLLGLFLYVDLRFFQSSQQILLSLLTFFILFAFLVYFTVLLYIFPVFVHFKFKTLEYIKYSFIIAVGRPLQTITMIVGSFLVYLVLSIIPVLLLFLSGSLLSIVLMWIAIKSFPKEEIGEGDN